MVNIIKKAFEYFDTSNLGELEETDVNVTKDSNLIGKPLPKREEVSRLNQKSIAIENKTVSNQEPVRVEISSRTTASASVAEPQSIQPKPLWSSERVQTQLPPLPKAPTERPRKHARVQTSTPTTVENDGQSVRVTIKHPQLYEDAPAIVDLLMAHEIILIDFKDMDEVQARRCIDFLDGASQVLAGSLQRVGGSLYLLAPKYVLVTAEELRQARNKQELSYDYDMKRR